MHPEKGRRRSDCVACMLCTQFDRPSRQLVRPSQHGGSFGMAGHSRLAHPPLTEFTGPACSRARAHVMHLPAPPPRLALLGALCSVLCALYPAPASRRIACSARAHALRCSWFEPIVSVGLACSTSARAPRAMARKPPGAAALLLASLLLAQAFGFQSVAPQNRDQTLQLFALNASNQVCWPSHRDSTPRAPGGFGFPPTTRETHLALRCSFSKRQASQSRPGPLPLLARSTSWQAPPFTRLPSP
jgi:hypothetical protein